MQHHLFTVPALALVTALTVTQAAVFTPQQEAVVINFVTSLRKCRNVVGLTLAVAKGNETWTRGFGLADRERGINVTTDHLFGIGSLTKAFATALISLFINDTGRYTWQTPVADILGKDFHFATEQLTSQLTLKDMLTHRTGLDSTVIPFFAGFNMSRAEFARLFRYLPTKMAFRDEFEYNNWLYGLAGHVTEVMAGGVPWEEILQTRLLQPLNMTQTRVMGRTASVMDDNFARPYVMLDDRIIPSDPAIYRISPQEAAGAIASSADDMAKWLLLHINKGSNQNGDHVLNDTRMREMSSAHVSLSKGFRALTNLWRPYFPITYASDAYGYGWVTATYRGYPVMWHSGGIFAYTSYIAFLPYMDLGVFISTNGPGSTSSNASHIVTQVLFYIADILMEGVDPWLTLDNACQFPDLWMNKTSEDQAPNSNETTIYDDPDFQDPDRYAGRYGHPLYGDVDVIRNGSLGLIVHYGHLQGRLLQARDGKDEEHVAMWEVLGRMEPVFRDGNKTIYIRLNFNQPSFSSSSSSSSSFPKVGGEFQELILGQVGVNEKLIFQRGAPLRNRAGRVQSGMFFWWPRGCSGAFSGVVIVGAPLRMFVVMLLLHSWAAVCCASVR